MITRAFLLLIGLSISSSAIAYTGPGLGLGLIGTILGIVFSILLAVIAIFWYPLKRMLFKKDQLETRQNNPESVSPPVENQAASTEPELTQKEKV